MLERIGGRKFIGFVILVAAGIVIELKTANGISVNLAGLLVGLYTIYAASNAVITNKSLGIEASTGSEPAANDPEMVKQIEGVLTQIGSALQQLQAGQVRNEQAIQTLQQATASVQKGVGAVLASRE